MTLLFGGIKTHFELLDFPEKQLFIFHQWLLFFHMGYDFKSPRVFPDRWLSERHYSELFFIRTIAYASTVTPTIHCFPNHSIDIYTNSDPGIKTIPTRAYSYWLNVLIQSQKMISPCLGRDKCSATVGEPCISMSRSGKPISLYTGWGRCIRGTDKWWSELRRSADLKKLCLGPYNKQGWL